MHVIPNLSLLSFFYFLLKPEISQEAEEMLMHRVLLWLNTNRARAVNLFQKFDTNNDNMLSTDEFFVGMRMMGVSSYD